MNSFHEKNHQSVEIDVKFRGTILYLSLVDAKSGGRNQIIRYKESDDSI